MKPSETEELSENIEVVTPGDMLREARLALQLTPEDVANKLNLRESLIHALESNDFDDLPSVTFTRGYLKGYAKLLGLNEDDVLEAFEYLHTVEQNQLEMQSFSNRSSQKTADNWLSIVSLLVAFVLIALAIVWWLQRNETSEVNNPPAQSTEQAQTAEVSGNNDDTLLDDAETTENDDAAEVTDNPEQTQGQEDAGAELSDEQQSLVAEIDEQKPQDSAQDSEQNLADSEPEGGQQAAEQSAKLSDLELHFSDSCWINISDATGKRIAIGTKVKGHITKVQGVAPFTIKLGKPDVVTIFLNSTEKKIPYYPKGSVANFVLSED